MHAFRIASFHSIRVKQSHWVHDDVLMMSLVLWFIQIVYSSSASESITNNVLFIVSKIKRERYDRRRQTASAQHLFVTTVQYFWKRVTLLMPKKHQQPTRLECEWMWRKEFADESMWIAAHVRENSCTHTAVAICDIWQWKKWCVPSQSIVVHGNVTERVFSNAQTISCSDGEMVTGNNGC